MPRPSRGARTIARRRHAAASGSADVRPPAEIPAYRERFLLGRSGRLGLATSDSWFSSFRTRIRAYGQRQEPHAKPRGLPQPFSFIRTLTVGFGIAPNLLTLPRLHEEGARGLGFAPLPPAGTFTPP